MLLGKLLQMEVTYFQSCNRFMSPQRDATCCAVMHFIYTFSVDSDWLVSSRSVICTKPSQ